MPHNLEISGWLRLSEAEDGDDPLRDGQVPVHQGGTHLELLIEGHPHYDSPLLDKAADWYASVFAEPNKLLKVTFEQFKDHLEKTLTHRELSASMA